VDDINTTKIKITSKRSELFLVVFVVSADGATQHSFFSVSLVIAAHRALSGSWALRQLCLGVFADVVSTALSFMAGVAEVSVAPTEPLRNAAAEFAFELDEVLAMFRAVLDWDVAATRTDQLLSLEGTSGIVSFVHSSHTVLPTSEVRLFALETHKVGVD
jgi:hypothetical protein